MRMKSKYLKRWNLPPYGVKLDSIKSKPYPVLIAILFLGAALISLNQKVIGIAILVLACYQLGIGNNSVLCEFYDRYVVFTARRIRMAVTSCSGRMWPNGSISAD